MALSMLNADVPSGSLALWWLGQAGFAFKSPSGRIVYLDPYLSDAVERLHGFKRLSLPPVAADEVRADLVVLTHEHTDHLDPDALPIIAEQPLVPVCGAGRLRCRADRGGRGGSGPLDPRTARRYEVDGVVIHTAPADHGDLSPTALCLVLEFEGLRVLCTGDTAFRPQAMKPLFEPRPDVMLPCINGVFGNMGPIDAAMIVHEARPRYAIPCHFGMFAEQGASDPAGFVYASRHFSPEVIGHDA